VNIGVVSALLDNKNQFYGVLGMDITLENLKDYLEHIDVEHYGYLLLMDNEETILSSRDKSHLFQNFFTIYNYKFEFLPVEPKGFTILFDNNKRKYLIYRKSAALNWTIAFVITAERIDKQVRLFVYKIVFVLLLSLLFLSVLTILGLEFFVIRPLSIVNTSTKLIAETGDLDHRVQYQSRDEIGSLAASFNKMTIDLKRYIKQLSESIAASERMESELKIAHEIQMGILPKEFPPFPGKYQIDIHAALEPAKQVGGDLYDFFFTKEDQLYFTIGDVAGKGVAAAVFMSAVKTLIKATARSINKPENILSLVNTELSTGNDHGTFVTTFLGVMNIRTGEISYVNAGHNPPLILKQNGQATFLESERNIALGLNEDFTFKPNEYTLKPGETIFLYTDGVTEAFNKQDELYSAEKLQKELSNLDQDSAKGIVSCILNSVKAFSTDVPQSDDITIFALKYMYKEE
jgi:sigma-B regulation protein RsbU (phosphoserine phosphatase)